MTAVNLASARLGAQAIACSDDSFAAMERMIQDSDPVFIADKYDNFGKWMDGWESKRRRSGGYDWCVVQLAVPGRIESLDINTTHFTGNYPPAACVEASGAEQCPSVESDDWQAITPLLNLKGDQDHHCESMDADTVFRWVRLKIYPDGGVARLRVWGQAAAMGDGTEHQELSALLNGGSIVAYSDAHYGNVESVLTPGRGVDMGDGWETARRRVPGNEWIIIALGQAGVIDELEIDTAHFKGNFPAGVSVQAAHMPALGAEAMVTQAMFWPEILAEQALSADNIHRFKIDCAEAITHIKVNSHPDGGMSRIRAFGVPKA